MDALINDFRQNLQQTLISLREDIKLVRTGRTSPALVEDLLVEAYGGQTKLKLKELATIATEGPAQLAIVPFDPTTIADIERAILKSSLGFSPLVQGAKVFVKIPALSQEQREKMLKIISQKVEEKKEIIRNHRDEVRKKIRSLLENKEITEDDKFRIEKEVDIITQKFTEELQGIKESKEKEIMEV